MGDINSIVKKYSQLVRPLIQVEQVNLSGMLLVMGNKDQYIGFAGGWLLIRKSKSYVGRRKLDVWGCFVMSADMFMRHVLHLSEKGVAVYSYFTNN